MKFWINLNICEGSEWSRRRSPLCKANLSAHKWGQDETTHCFVSSSKTAFSISRCAIPVVCTEHTVTIYAQNISVITQLYCITKLSTSTTCFGYFDLAFISLVTHVGEIIYTIQYKSQLSETVQCSVIQNNTKQSLVSG